MSTRPRGPLVRLLVACAAVPALVVGLSAQAHAHPRGPGGPPDAAGDLVVRTEQGKVRGSAQDDVRLFQGVPYAAPPERWQPPQPPSAWRGVRPATEPGSECVQAAVFWRPGTPASWNEDCLNLNVWTPATVDESLPVLVWFHGGGWVNGAGTDVMPERLTAAGNVVVTVNYRLGAEGYLSLPGLDAESADGASSGQYGDLDKIRALEWVQQNIAAFGGNADDVTIAGQSAGAGSACWLMASPAAAGLFDRAIIQSIGDCRAISHEEAAQRGQTFAEAIGCPDIEGQVACLRSRTPAEIIDAQAASGVSWNPVIGGAAAPVSVTEAFATGAFNRVPVIIGNTRNETRAFVYEGNDLVRQPLTAAAYEERVRTRYGADADRVLAEYPVSAHDGSGGLALAAVQTDSGWACPSIGVADSLSQFVPTFAYEFRDETAPLRPYMVIPPSFPIGSMHTADVPYVWESTTMTPLTEEQRELASLMTSYWSQFAETGSPDAAGLPEWPGYTAGDGLRMTFLPGGETEVIDGADYAAAHHCGFWASMP